jgi:hypothetical protein
VIKCNVMFAQFSVRVVDLSLTIDGSLCPNLRKARRERSREGERGRESESMFHLSEIPAASSDVSAMISSLCRSELRRRGERFEWCPSVPPLPLPLRAVPSVRHQPPYIMKRAEQYDEHFKGNKTNEKFHEYHRHMQY